MTLVQGTEMHADIRVVVHGSALGTTQRVEHACVESLMILLRTIVIGTPLPPRGLGYVALSRVRNQDNLSVVNWERLNLCADAIRKAYDSVSCLPYVRIQISYRVCTC